MVGEGEGDDEEGAPAMGDAGKHDSYGAVTTIQNIIASGCPPSLGGGVRLDRIATPFGAGSLSADSLGGGGHASLTLGAGVTCYLRPTAQVRACVWCMGTVCAW